ncbi:hypothetical protein MUG94_16045 [Arthrobacter gengyunqii]|uniref:Uncharacterized protein n=1 Tax=Arthrobacter gengyunqii TaxID=2886940 RepID=A0A9X1M0E3_9MICC|nr:hypothetical protein [Arthrobacter gengyunqii]MCC3265869.1 hypothetical protein [Arthrobacter gengyunqii]MCC3268625.1 hypothetical protein [Arthrobacter gengyunqii]UOY96013.1 hypothetical protein MUG94_16045 [Arthrobacter gengyunqii]
MSSTFRAPAPATSKVHPATLFCALTAALSIPMALLIPLWITAGRVLFGIHGNLVAIFAATIGPLMVILMLLSAVRITVAATRRPRFGAPMRTSFLLLGLWLAGGTFGFLVPDVGGGSGRNGSIVTALLGSDAGGFSAALANPVGMLTLGLTVVLLVVSVRDSRQA